ncbi:MAG: Trk family potassium uptake protein [Phycisphaerae bacterium]|nr:Trk family potassium uptake protein [Phycisphaerae bacterium]
MKIAYKNSTLEQVLTGVKAAASATIVASFALSFGFYEPPLPTRLLAGVLTGMLFIFVGGKMIRFFNAQSRREYLVANWYEIPMLMALVVILVGAGRWFGRTEPGQIQHWAIALYLIVDVTIKFFMVCVRLAATGKDPTRVLVASFIVLILTGACLLMLPKATPGRASLPFVDALFTSTSATCVTGLAVKDTGADFTLMGQLVILALIQLGGLGIVVLGAVLALLLGQALSVRESAAIQDLLSEGTLSRINRMVVFVFIATALIELTGAVALLHLWDDVPGRVLDVHHQWYYSVFHSISAFCNAGFGLFGDSLISYNRCWEVYLVICPLIVLGGLGFGVLYDLGGVILDRTLRICKRSIHRRCPVFQQGPRRMWLQTKIVLAVTVCLIVGGMLALFAFEKLTGQGPAARDFSLLDALFQSVTARTAGFNTVNIAALSDAGKFLLILLMLIGGSPGGTAGGIKTVTFVVILMAVVATLRRREDVEIFNRSIRLLIVRRAITVAVLFVVALFGATLGLCITEASSHFTMMQIFFEVASALGTVGLSTGITPSLTTAGRFIIILVMLTGRLGPLTLLAALAFNAKPVRYNYPDEAIVVG